MLCCLPVLSFNPSIHLLHTGAAGRRREEEGGYTARWCRVVVAERECRTWEHAACMQHGAADTVSSCFWL